MLEDANITEMSKILTLLEEDLAFDGAEHIMY